MARADLWRLLVIWVHGGLYLDMKSVALKPPQPLKGKMIMSRWYIPDCLQANEVINWYVYAPKKNPVLRHLIDSVIENIKAQQSNTRSNEYYKLVAKELSCSGEAKARVLYTTGPRALTLALDLIPESLEEWMEESSHTSSWENPLALDGAVRYKSEEEKTSHINIEGSNHYTNLIDVPLTSRTIYSTTMHP